MPDTGKMLTATATLTADGLVAAVNCSDWMLTISSVDSESGLGAILAERLAALLPLTGLTVLMGLPCTIKNPFSLHYILMCSHLLIGQILA